MISLCCRAWFITLMLGIKSSARSFKFCFDACNALNPNPPTKINETEKIDMAIINFFTIFIEFYLIVIGV